MNTKSLTAIIIVLAVALLAVAGTVVAMGARSGNEQAGAAPTTAVVAGETTAVVAGETTSTSAKSTMVTAAAPATTMTTIDADSASEEELAQAISDAMEDTNAAVEELTVAVEESTADGTVTEAEAVQVEVSLANSEEIVAYTDELAQTYTAVYGDYAGETIATLETMEEDLDTIATSTETIATILEQGSETAVAAVTQVEHAAATAGSSAMEAQTQAAGWTETLDQLRGQREQQALDLPPSEIPSDPAAAIASARSYVDTVSGALIDGVVSGSELSSVAQAGANASAGLQAQGGRMGEFSTQLNALTAQLARGEVPQAGRTLPSLESSIRSLPSPPSGGVKRR